MAYGGQSWLRRRPIDSFFPPCCCEPAMLEEGVGDHRHKRMSVKALPGSSLEVVKTKLFFHLLVACSQTQRALMVVAKVRRSVFAGRLAR